MRAKPVAAEIFAETFGDGMHGKSAGVGGDDGAGLAHGFYLAEQSALEFEVFDDGFDDPVALGEETEMILEVSGGDQAGESRFHESSRLGLASGVQTGVGDAVADGRRGIIRRSIAPGLATCGKDIEQIRTHPGIGQVRGDAGAHGSRAEDGDFLNSFEHW